MPATLSLTLASRLDEVPHLVTSLEAFGARTGLSDAMVFRLTLALDEVVTNIVRHAFAGEGEHDILLRVTVDEGVVTAVVEDEGCFFDPLTVPPADISAPIEQRPIGGLGVHLMRSLTQSLEYRRDRDRNVLTMTFGPE